MIGTDAEATRLWLGSGPTSVCGSIGRTVGGGGEVTAAMFRGSGPSGAGTATGASVPGASVTGAIDSVCPMEKKF